MKSDAKFDVVIAEIFNSEALFGKILVFFFFKPNVFYIQVLAPISTAQ